MNFFQDIPKDKQQKIILVGIGTLIGAALIYQFYLSSQLSGISTARQRIASLTIQIEDSEKLARDLVRNAPLREQYRQFVSESEPVMVSGDPFSWVVRETSLASEDHSVRILGLRPGTVRNHSRFGRYEVYTARIELAGRYDEIGKFVADLETRFPFAEIRSVEISAGDPATGRRATLEIAFLVRPDLESAATAKPESEPKG
jgi:Tfp pilus assembly protein PilO